MIRPLRERRDVEEALRASERRYRELVEKSLGLICTHDLAGNLLAVNPAAARVFGYEPAELARMNLRDLLAPAVRNLLDDYLQEFATQKTDSGLMRVLTRGGEERVLYFQNTLCEEPGQAPYVIGHALDITELLRAKEAVRDRERRLRLLVQQMPAVLWSTDRELRLTSSQGASLAELGLQPDEAVGMTLWDYFRTDDPTFVAIAAHRRALSGEPSHYEITWQGRIFDSHVEPLRDRHGEIAGTIGVARDITARKQAEGETRRAVSLLGATLESTADGILVVDTGGGITSFNRKFAQMCGVPESTLRRGEEDGVRELVLDRLEEPTGFLTAVRDLSSHPDAGSFDVVELADGRVFERYSQPQRVGDEIVGRVWSFRDVTERRRAEERIEHQAYHDALTGLPNRLLVKDRLEVALASAHRHHQSVAVLFLDLDHFKLVNDTLGHSVGDELLQAVTERLEASIREGDTLGRLGGDEFTLVLPGIAQAEDAARVAQQILEAITRPFHLASSQIDVTTSIGISLFPYDGDDVETLLRSADTAMYRAKELGRNTYQLSTPELNRRASRRMSLVGRLRRAIERDQLVLHYQPILEARSRRVLTVEALLRWRDGNGGLVLPADFIPVADELHLMVPIDEWVLHAACEQLARWQEVSPGVRVAVNLSSWQFQQPDLTETVERTLDATGLEPGLLEVEIAETTAMNDVERASAALEALRRTGVRVSIDDFGSGQTSLSYLRRLPIHAIKIDRSFVHDLATSPQAAAIVTALLGMARGLDLGVIAEGVETEEQLAFLVAEGCDAVQGYLFGRPAPAEEIGEILRAGAVGTSEAL